jgi:hypothetical protein
MFAFDEGERGYGVRVNVCGFFSLGELPLKMLSIVLILTAVQDGRCERSVKIGGAKIVFLGRCGGGAMQSWNMTSQHSTGQKQRVVDFLQFTVYLPPSLQRHQQSPYHIYVTTFLFLAIVLPRCGALCHVNAHLLFLN